MNEALPRWRTFSSTTAGAAPSDTPAAAAHQSRLPDRAGVPGHWVAIVAAALGGAAAGAALAILGLALTVDLSPAAGVLAGDPLTAAAFASTDGPPADAQLGSATGLGLAGASSQASGRELFVDVAGAVQQPGLHRLRAGDRVADAISAAGGYAARVDLAAASSTLNLAEALTDGAKVIVPELGMGSAPIGAPDDDRIDLNVADQAALESLPGIGPVTAGKIMAARSERAFTSIAELLDRDIVGQAVYDDIVDLVRVSG